MTIYAPLRVAGTVSANGAAVVGKHNPVDATSANRTLTLPTGQRDGSSLSVEKVDSSANTVTVSGSLRGSAGTLVLALSHETVLFVCDSAGSWWPTAGHKTKASIDGLIDGKITTDQTRQNATYVAGNVYNNDGVTQNLQKRLHVVLTADGTDIDSLVIETVA